MIQEPVILAGDGGPDIFRTTEEAERYAEPMDIENGEYVAYDAAGRLLNLGISQNGFHGKLTLPEPAEDRSEELADGLRAFLENVAAARQVPFDASRLREYPLERLVQISLEFYTQSFARHKKCAQHIFASLGD